MLWYLKVVSFNYSEQFGSSMEQWKMDDRQFVSTEAEKQVIQNILSESYVTIIGSSGSGKSFLLRHVALKMMEKGYIIIPCSHPENIRQRYKQGSKTLFVFDDVYGRYTIDEQMINDWEQRLGRITSMLKDKCFKIMCTCRLDIFKDEKCNSLSILNRFCLDLSSHEFRLNAIEKFDLAQVYFKENYDKDNELSERYNFYHFVRGFYDKENPQKYVSIGSFCRNPFDVFKDELDMMYTNGDNGKMKYCSLTLCVLLNNTITEQDLSKNNKEIEIGLGDVLRECGLKQETYVNSLKESLKSLEGTYLVIEDNVYKVIHDKLFDFLAKYFGEKMLQLFIDNASTSFIRERFLWKSEANMDADIEFAITIPDTHVDRYIDRLLKDWGE